MPIAPLMVEHRLIDRMIALMRKELPRMHEGHVALDFIGSAVDFFVTYVDLCHHGKEEDILFRELDRKEISRQQRTTMKELVAEHVLARKIVAGLDEARGRYVLGSGDAVAEMAERIKEMIELYPAHIEKEDRHFFIPSMQSFTAEEQDAMLAAMQEFDRQLLQKVYRNMVDSFERTRAAE